MQRWCILTFFLLLAAPPAAATAQLTGGAIRSGPRVVRSPVRPVEVLEESNPSPAEALSEIEALFARAAERYVAGAPLGPITPLGDGYVREHVNGTIYHRPSTDGPREEEREPDEWCKDVWGRVIDCPPPQATAYYVSDGILERYRQLGGPTGLLGWPVSERGQTTGGSWFGGGTVWFVQQFDRALIYWQPGSGMVEVEGAEPLPR